MLKFTVNLTVDKKLDNMSYQSKLLDKKFIMKH